MAPKLRISPVFFIFLCSLLHACGHSDQSVAGDQTSLHPAQRDARTGATIFDKNCKICHGLDGRLGLNGAKDLSVSMLPLKDRIQVITNGRNLMTPFGKLLTPAEIDSVAVFTLQLQKSNPN